MDISQYIHLSKNGEEPLVSYMGEHVIFAAEVCPKEYQTELGQFVIITNKARHYVNEGEFQPESRPGLLGG